MGAVNDIYLLQVRGSLYGQAYIHTLHAKSNLVGTDASIQQDLIDTWQAGPGAAWLPAHPPDYQLVDITAQRICGSLPLPAATIENVNLVGTRSMTGLPQNAAPWIACLVRERTGFAGRSYAGRFFMSGLNEIDLNITAILPSYTALADAYVASLAPLLSGGSDPDWDLFVYSRKLASQPGVQCQNTGAPVTSLAVSATLTTMKSRRS